MIHDAFLAFTFSFRMYEALERDPKAGQTIWPKNNTDNDLMYHKRALHFYREEKNHKRPWLMNKEGESL